MGWHRISSLTGKQNKTRRHYSSGQFGGVFAEGEGEDIILGEQLGETAVVGDESRCDANTATSLVDAIALLEVTYRTDTISFVHSETNRSYSPTARSKNVRVSKKKSAVKPTDLRSEAMLRTRNKSR